MVPEKQVSLIQIIENLSINTFINELIVINPKMEYITGYFDTDYLLLDYLFIVDILKLCQVNRSINGLVKNTPIYAEYAVLFTYFREQKYTFYNDYILCECYRRGLINILKNYHNAAKKFIINDAIDMASGNGHINVLEWFKNSGFFLDIQCMQ